jgi:molybdenum cofactor cytidylyltransferase
MAERGLRKSKAVIASIIIAAGESKRMGYPKALLKYRGLSFLDGIIGASSAAALEPIVVVLGHDASKILGETDLRRCIEVRNQQPETGQIGSIKRGLSAIVNHLVEAAMVWPVDQPHISIETVRRLVDAFHKSLAPVVIPTWRGRRGHPALFSRVVFDELLDAPAELGARGVVRSHGPSVVEVPVTDEAVVEDIDTPADYRMLLRRSGSGANR